MKRIGIISTATALFLLLWFNAPAGAQDKPDKQDKDKQEQQDKHEKESKPEKQQPAAKPDNRPEARPDKAEPAAKPDNRQEARPDKQTQERQQPQQQEQSKPQQTRAQQPEHQQAQPQEQSRPQARPEERQQPQQQASRPSEQGRRVQQGEQRVVWQQHRARSWESEHRTWQQRGGYSGYRIPEATFRISFGEVHTFRVYSLPVLIVGESPRFQYGGFWFSLVDPWPETWSDDWYETDDVYIDYYGDGYYMYNRRHPGVRIAINVFIG